MAVFLRASRGRRRARVRHWAPAAPPPSPVTTSPRGPQLASRLLDLVEGLLLAADCLDFICSGAWLLPAAALLAGTGARRPPPPG